MKKTLISIAAATLVFAGCNREVFNSEETGALELDLSCLSDLNETTTKASDDEDIINNLTVKLLRPYDGWEKTYAPFSTIRGKVIELSSGDYILTASSPDRSDAAFEQPIYDGSKNITIKTGEVTPAAVTCKVSNMKLSLILSENFYNELSDFTITVNNGKGLLTWEKNSTKTDFAPATLEGVKVYTVKKAGYFTVGTLTAQVSGHRAIDGTTAQSTSIISNTSAADHHILNVDAQVTGSLQGITITIDHSVNPVNTPVIVPGFDEIPVPGDPGTEEPGTEEPEPENPGTDPAPSTQPTMTWEANPSFAPMNINESLNADLVVTAPEKVASFKVQVDSPCLTETISSLTQDGTSTMDLINDEGLISFLADAAPTLPTGNDLKGQTNINFFLTSLVKLIDLYGSAPGNRHNFTLVVTDEKGQTLNQTVTFVSE